MESILKLQFHNIITNVVDYIELYYPYVNYERWKRTEEYKNDYDLIKILNDILDRLDCTKTIFGMRMCMTTVPLYRINLSNYYYYLNKLNNQFIYNDYIDILLETHVRNLLFEYNNPILKNPHKKGKVKNVFYKATTRDLFTNELIYVYTNDKTGEVIRSTNPDLLEQLNAPKKIKKKHTVVKEIGVPMKNMTFTFKKQ